MLKQRILLTLKFFDLQDCPLTLLELYKFLLPAAAALEKLLDGRGEFMDGAGGSEQRADIAEIKKCLDLECANEVVQKNGFYALSGRGEIIESRQKNYFFSFAREKLIKKYLPALRHVPFVRGAAILGSQALGLPREGSDIDLLILVDPQFMGLARLFVTLYFQILGVRRHGKYIKNRFCLNHYAAAGKRLNLDRNLYTAAEYLKMRPVVYGLGVESFRQMNREWLSALYPNAKIFAAPDGEKAPLFQKFFEGALNNYFGGFLERAAKKTQYARINRSEFIVVTQDELSFHPNNRKQELFRKFFAYMAARRPTVSPVVTVKNHEI